MSITPPLLLTIYCSVILLVSVLGGLIPVVFSLSHRMLEIAVSFVAGFMLGAAMLHLLPEAIHFGVSVEDASVVIVIGLLTMFFVERFFCFHHHEASSNSSCSHGHTLSWSGAAVGLTLHSLFAGVALAAAVLAEGSAVGSLSVPLALPVFLAIVLHKPFDALTIATLMAKGGWSRSALLLVNALFSLVVPIGVLLFYLGANSAVFDETFAGWALAFSTGVFLCIALSDLLPELQFHQHDRFKLSLAMLLGIGLAWCAATMGRHEHHEHHAESNALSQYRKSVSIYPCRDCKLSSYLVDTI